MGGKHGKPLPRKVLTSLTQETNFDAGTVKRLHIAFHIISSTVKDDGVIDAEEFQTAIGFHSAKFCRRIFQLFDGDDDLLINFEEFVKAMNILMLPSASNDKDGLVEEKLKFSFQVYDEDKDNKISKVELSNAFSDVMDTRNITITKAQLAAVVNATFKQASTANADFITYEEYRSLIKSNPNSLQNFIAAYSVDIDAALQNAAAMHRAAKQKQKKKK